MVFQPNYRSGQMNRGGGRGGYSHSRGGSRGGSSYRGGGGGGYHHGGSYNDRDNSRNRYSGGGGGGNSSSYNDNRSSRYDKNRYSRQETRPGSGGGGGHYKRNDSYKDNRDRRSPDRKRPRADHSQVIAPHYLVGIIYCVCRVQTETKQPVLISLRFTPVNTQQKKRICPINLPIDLPFYANLFFLFTVPSQKSIIENQSH
uniref:(northern house mosquito) hypothetical protein n=1 Tax=Culex pipiens TaxID=7175 RepID=A0A8D8DN07_CULPI